MNEQLKFIVEKLNKEPFKRSYNLISFDSLEPLQLLQVMNDVLAEINPQNKLDIREETADGTAVRMMNELRVLKYKPNEEPSTFRQGLVSGYKPVIYPILVWLFQRIPELKKRAYLARFLVKIEVPPEIIQDDQVADTYGQYAEMVSNFKELHKESEALKTGGFSTSEIRRDITQMEEEKEQISKRIERLKKRVETVQNHEQMLEIASNFRLEQEREMMLVQQKQDQTHQLHHTGQRQQRFTQQLKDIKLSIIGATAEGLVKKLEAENKMNSYLSLEKLPKEIEGKRRGCQELERVVNEPSMGQNDLNDINTKIKSVNTEVNGLIEERMRSADHTDTKVHMYRQQATIITRKKEAAAETLGEAKEEMLRCQSEVFEKREAIGGLHGEGVLKGEEFKRYINKLRSKSTVYKQKRQELAELRAEHGVLSRTEDILTQRDEQLQHQLGRLEAKKGVAGYQSTQEELEKVSAMKSGIDDIKGRTLEDMSEMVRKLNGTITSKKSDLAPVIKELRPLREKAAELEATFSLKKSSYETLAAGLESNRSKLDKEVRAYREEVSQEESRYHYLNCMLRMVEVQQRRISEEMKTYTSSDPMEKKKAFREQYTRRIQEQEKLGKSLRDKQKRVKDSHGPSIRQMKMWSDIKLLMECKLDCYYHGGKLDNAGSIVRDEITQEDRLILK